MINIRRIFDISMRDFYFGRLRFVLPIFKGVLFYYANGLYKYNENPFCVLIGRKVKLDIDPQAKIIVSNGASLSIGLYESELVTSGRFSVKIRMECKSVFIINGKASIGCGCYIHVRDKAVLQLSNGVMVGDDRINCCERIEIGKNFMLSWGVDIMDNDGHPIFFEINDSNPTNKTAPVIIGDNCWIGHDAIILKGVVINDGAIIGAGSIVTRNVPHRTIVAGNPITEIKKNAYWKE